MSTFVRLCMVALCLPLFLSVQVFLSAKAQSRSEPFAVSYERHEIYYPSNGTRIQATIYKPRSPQDRGPAVVYCPAEGQDITGYEFLYESLTRVGITVLVTHYRSHSFLYDDVDLISAVGYSQTLPYVDPGRLGLCGHSLRGTCVLRVAAKESRIKSVVALAPVTDTSMYMLDMKNLSPMLYRVLVEDIGMGDPEKGEGYRRLSALAVADKLKAPVYILTGEGDMLAPTVQSELMYRALIKNGNMQSKLELIPEMGHFFEKSYNGYLFEQVAHSVTSWFEKTLK